MNFFEVQCIIGEDHFCIEVPTDCSVGDVSKKAAEHSVVKVDRVSLWYSDIPLNCEHLFADYFEPDAIYHVKVGGNYPEGSLLNSSEAKLRALGVTLKDPRLLMEMRELKWGMDEFLRKSGDFAATLVLIKLANGTECGGVAGVPWPKRCGQAADLAKGSFIFSLGTPPVRFDLVNPERALYCAMVGFGFGCGPCDLFVWNHGSGCGSYGPGDYCTGPCEDRQLVGAPSGVHEQPYERWELWRL